MKISDLIRLLEAIKKECGDKYIWSQEDLDFPCPRRFELELSDQVKRTNAEYLGIKTNETGIIDVSAEYDSNANLINFEF
jgi:hypothetical protein